MSGVRETPSRTLAATGRALCLALAVALAAVGLTLVSPPDATATGGSAAVAGAPIPCQRTFSTGPVNRPIPDLAAASVRIDVPEDGLVVTDVDVTVNLRHTAPTDLDITLVSETAASPFAGVNRLFERNGNGDGVDLRGTVFDDAAATSISAANAPYTGRFRPVAPMNIRPGQTGGEYRVLVVDTLAGDSGTFENWSATFTYENCDLDGDGVVVPADLCPTRVGRTASGCPTAGRSLRASYRAGKFRGRAASSVRACAVGVPVTVRKVRPGPDRKVGTTRTRADGTWRLTRAKRAGRYYATSPRVVLPGVAECPAVMSSRLRIR